MPELPEVETVRRSLAGVLEGRALVAVEVLDPRLVAPAAPAAFARRLVGQRVRRLCRRGKFLLFQLAPSGEVLLLHLRMTGYLLLAPRLRRQMCREPGLRARFGLEGGMDLLLWDLRRFGTAEVHTPVSLAHRLAALGPEPLGPAFTPGSLARRLAGRSVRVKTFLLDQANLAGLGNIYADEALFRAGIHPERRAGSLTEDEVSRLHQAIVELLEEAIAWGGTTVRTYRDARGAAGGFQQRLAVYGRAGQPCPRCGTPVARIRVAGRSSCFCPACQPVAGPGAGAGLQAVGGREAQPLHHRPGEGVTVWSDRSWSA